MTKPARLVLDTNTVLALWHFSDPRLAPLVGAIARKRFALLSRDDALEELRRVLARARFDIAPEQQARILAQYGDLLVPPPSGTATAFELPQCRDRDDQKFLEIARDHAASHLLTRDKRLLELNRHRLLRERFRIVTPEKFQAESGDHGG
ncbi:MAG: putative toxin-antitoxin system toxin component, PIN family [Azoarcus sp.]|jgi:putative PIN family toxin of toxin-antitoxin system|nr:putative toxin-antitoxin system toxin component, PIN family [Azoarcus sp.]